MKKFPEGFWWGSATSGPQAEGAALLEGKSKSIWDHWFTEQPERFNDQIGPQDASTFYQNWKEDIALMVTLGHNSFRTSIQWSRLIPDGTGKVNEKAVIFYNNVIDELIANKIDPFINLFHFDMPMCMQELGGWESREVINAYARYARICFELFGDRVKKWFTFNEPVVPVEAGYLYNLHYPNIVDFRRAAKVAFGTMLAHAKAVKAYRELLCTGQIGIILNLTPAYPRSQHPADVKAAKIVDLFFNKSFLDPATKGKYPEELIQLLAEYDQLPEVKEGDIELITEGIVDLLGVNYYMPTRVKARDSLPNPASPFMPEWFFDRYEMPNCKMNNYRGWEIYEKGIYDILTDLRLNYANIPCFISENGMGVANEERFLVNEQIQDNYRIEFVKDHLNWLHRAIAEGSNCLGYHLWTFIDCWSWANSYKNRYGWISLDLKTQKRTLKKSGVWFAQVSKDNGYE